MSIVRRPVIFSINRLCFHYKLLCRLPLEVASLVCLSSEHVIDCFFFKKIYHVIPVFL